MRQLLVFVSIVLFPLMLFAQESDTAPIRPNIIWIVCEDMSPHLSCYGDTTIHTPHLDGLASDGVRFTNAFAVAGVCAPSRSSIITGMYPTSIGANHMRNLNSENKQKIRSEDLTLPTYSVIPPPYVKAFPEFFRKEMYYCVNNSKEDYQFEAPVTVWDESSRNAHWKNTPEGKPFFAVFNINATHESQIWKRDSLPLLVDPMRITLPPYYPDVIEVRQDYARHLSNVIEMDRQVGRLLDELKSKGLYDNAYIFFYSDHGDGLPYVKREVTQRGLRIPLIIKYPKNIYAGHTNKDLVSTVDLAPTVLSIAGIPIPAYMHGSAFLGDQKGKSREYIFAARDRMDERVDQVRTVFDGRYQYIENKMPNLPYYQDIKYRLQLKSMRKIIELRNAGKLNALQNRWFENKPEAELYDIHADPFQLNNLIADHALKNQRNLLAEVLDQWKIKYGDRNAIPEDKMIEEMWQGKDSAPSTAIPVLSPVKGGYVITCATPGASIGYILESKEPSSKVRTGWKVYHHGTIKLNKGDKIIIQAQRIGFEPSVLEQNF